MESLVIEGKEYISAKRAAREHSYTMDYVGQLIRGGKLLGQKVGRAWYVERDSLTTYVRSLAGKEMKGQSHALVLPVGTTTNTGAAMQDIHISTAHTTVPIHHSSVQAIDVSHPSTSVDQARVEASEQPRFDYTMLNYVTEEGDSLPELGTKQIQVDTHEDAEIKINRIDNSVPEDTYIAPELETFPKQHIGTTQIDSYSPPTVATESEQERYPTQYRDHHPAKRKTILPTLVAAGVALVIFALAGGSLFFERTMSYESATSAVTTGFTYSDLGK